MLGAAQARIQRLLHRRGGTGAGLGDAVALVGQHHVLGSPIGQAALAPALPRKTTQVSADTHPRASPLEALAPLRPVYAGGVQTAGNSSALVDGAAAAGVPPEIMGIGPAPAIRALLARCGLALADISLVEINEAQGAQIIACERELGLDRRRLNVNGGAIAIGHPLAATGVRLTLTLAKELRRRGQRWGIAAACVGGGQGMALLVENSAL